MGLGSADRPQRHGDQRAIGGVDQHLAQEVAAEPRRRVCHGRGGTLEIRAAEQPDEPVAQILALEQDEDNEQKHDAGGGERRQQRADDGLIETPSRRLGRLDLDRDRRVARLQRRRADAWRGGRACRLVELLLQVGQHVACPFQHLRFARGVAQRRDLLRQRGAVVRQVGGELGRLARHHPAKGEDEAEGDGDDDADREHARHLDLAEHEQRRGQHEAQQDGERERQQHLAGDVEPGDEDDADQQPLQHRGAGVGRRGQEGKRRAGRHLGPPGSGLSGIARRPIRR